MNRKMTQVTLVAALMFALVVPASAEVYRVANKADTKQVAIIDCPQTPQGRDLAWVRTNCKVLTTTNSGRQQSLELNAWHELVILGDM